MVAANTQTLYQDTSPLQRLVALTHRKLYVDIEEERKPKYPLKKPLKHKRNQLLTLLT